MKASVEVFSPVDNACVSPRAAFVHVPPGASLAQALAWAGGSRHLRLCCSAQHRSLHRLQGHAHRLAHRRGDYPIGRQLAGL